MSRMLSPAERTVVLSAEVNTYKGLD